MHRMTHTRLLSKISIYTFISRQIETQKIENAKNQSFIFSSYVLNFTIGVCAETQKWKVSPANFIMLSGISFQLKLNIINS